MRTARIAVLAGIVLALAPAVMQEMRDPAARAAFVEAERRRQASPGFRRAAAYLEWLDGPGACIAQAHRRLRASAAGVVLGAVAMALLAAKGHRDRATATGLAR